MSEVHQQIWKRCKVYNHHYNLDLEANNLLSGAIYIERQLTRWFEYYMQVQQVGKRKHADLIHRR